MITVKKETTIAGLSELRNKSDLILRQVKLHDVVLEKHNKPVVVMVDYERHHFEEEMLELAEDYILGSLAAQRDKKASPKDYVDIEDW